jgi:hypothetical protein
LPTYKVSNELNILKTKLFIPVLFLHEREANPMNPILTFNGNYIEFCDFTFDYEAFEIGNPYNCTFNLRAKSGDFAGLSPCEADRRKLIVFVTELKEMYNFRQSAIDFQEISYGGTLHFSADGIGHITISGHIFGYDLEHELKFEFTADQTALLPFITELEHLINNC